ncbi:metal ABC transporter substrate-binding protein [Clostridium massiliamazoniense]|uniref:metal ABC transporter substrate-binding protein n=1 Tax=Clostridium massiliamazoniense TaxID=1347366 RepID=UPI0006D78761|nr:metal ABC transporter substrate-binding protein [Clostridium massiliamazoniense]
MKKKIFFGAIVIATLLGVMVGCNKTEKVSKENDNKIEVMTSIYPIGEFAKVIGGDKVNVRTMVPSGAEPHDFEPKAKDIVKLNESDLFIYNGLQMENWVDKVIKSVENKNLVIVNSSKNANVIANTEDEHEDEEEGHGGNLDHSGHNHGQEDPHIWLGLDEATKQCALIRDALIKVDPNNKAYYEENYNKFATELKNLKEEYKEKFASKDKKDFITGHAAFAYLCRDFGLEQRSLEGVFGEGEVTPKHLKNLVEYCKANNIKTVFMPETASEKLSQTLANEVGAKVVKISSLETNSSGKDYLNTMKDNLEAIYENI